jgi:predicted enzyme related to lactoylglutathione lyase
MSTTAEQTAEKAKAVANTVVWFDMPVQDLDRAMRFYAAVLGSPPLKQEYSGMAFAVLPHEEGAVSGCLTPSTEGNPNKPSAQGPLLYLSCQGRLDEAVAAVAPNGGKVLQARHPIGPYGFRAVVLDSEGNRIALHSM